jgi:UPF0716 protein FxsA
MPLLIGFLLWPIAEIWLLIEIGGEIGAWATIGWILATAVAAGVLLRRQGSQAMGRIRQALAGIEGNSQTGGAALAGELLNGLGVFFAGLCLILPGFLTDAIGIFLVVPLLRRVIGRGLWNGLQNSQRVRVYAAGGSHPFKRGPFRQPDPTIIEGDYSDVTEPRPAPLQDRLPPRAP